MAELLQESHKNLKEEFLVELLIKKNQWNPWKLPGGTPSEFSEGISGGISKGTTAKTPKDTSKGIKTGCLLTVKMKLLKECQKIF